MPSPRVVVVGASAGGIEAVTSMIRRLPADFPAAVFVVVHRGRGPSLLADLFARATSLPVVEPADGDSGPVGGRDWPVPAGVVKEMKRRTSRVRRRRTGRRAKPGIRSRRGSARGPGPPDSPTVEPAPGEKQPLEGTLSAFRCPECGGALWELADQGLGLYRCHVGHGFAAEGLASLTADRLEDTLWSAVRALKDHAALRRQMADRAAIDQLLAAVHRLSRT